MQNRFRSALWRGTPWLLIALILAFGFVAALRLGYQPDEMEHLHAAWNVGQGRLPYHDFFEHHPPLFYTLLAPFLRAQTHAGFSLLLTLRLLALGIFTLILLQIARLWNEPNPPTPFPTAFASLTGKGEKCRIGLPLSHSVGEGGGG